MRLEIIKDLLHNMKGFLQWYFAPTVSADYVYEYDYVYIPDDSIEYKYTRCWLGLDVGRWVKVNSIDLLKKKYNDLESKNDTLKETILNKIDKEIKTHVQREKTIKEQIKRIVEEEMTDNGF